jgi:hypothetical protein
MRLPWKQSLLPQHLAKPLSGCQPHLLLVLLVVLDFMHTPASLQDPPPAGQQQPRQQQQQAFQRMLA